jgi:ActR/RegA family two-component response regulator
LWWIMQQPAAFHRRMADTRHRPHARAVRGARPVGSVCGGMLVYAQTGNLEETARRLGMDWRTVRTKLGMQPEPNGEKR